jgi:hypothetical protein
MTDVLAGLALLLLALGAGTCVDALGRKRG